VHQLTDPWSSGWD